MDWILNITITDGIGYAAMLLLVVSFLFKDMTKLRIVNTVACLFFIAYGYLLDSLPIMISNAFIACVNTYYLLKKEA